MQLQVVYFVTSQMSKYRRPSGQSGGLVRFAIETTAARGPLTGIGHYVQRLSQAIIPLLKPEEMLIAFDGTSCAPLDLASLTSAELQNDAMSDDFPGRGFARAKYNAYLTLRQAGPIRSVMRYLKEKAFQANEHKFDVFHAVQMIPPGPFKKPVLPVIHDLSHLRFPDSHPSERVRWLEKRIKLVVDGAPFIQTVSEFSKQEIMDLLDVPSERIRVCYPGIVSPLATGSLVSHRSDSTMKKYAVTAGNYFLMVSTREPRKNFKTMTSAYASLPDHIRRQFPLLWVGHRGWGNLDLSPAAERAIFRGEIRILGYVSDRDLPSLYRHARLFTMPSIYEGFGMPITEALASGTPVAISDIPVFREVAGAFARYVSPLDVDGWREAMSDAVEGIQKRVDRESLALWLQRYTWTRNATQTLDLYRRLAS